MGKTVMRLKRFDQVNCYELASRYALPREGDRPRSGGAVSIVRPGLIVICVCAAFFATPLSAAQDEWDQIEIDAVIARLTDIEDALYDVDGDSANDVLNQLINEFTTPASGHFGTDIWGKLSEIEISSDFLRVYAEDIRDTIVLVEQDTTGILNWLGDYGLEAEDLATIETLLGQLVNYGSLIDATTATISSRVQTLINQTDAVENSLSSINLNTFGINSSANDIEAATEGMQATMTSLHTAFLEAVGPVQGLVPIQQLVVNVYDRLNLILGYQQQFEVYLAAINGHLDSIEAIAEALQDELAGMRADVNTRLDDVIAQLEYMTGENDPTEDVDQQPYDTGDLIPPVQAGFAMPDPADAETVTLGFSIPTISVGTAPVWSFNADDFLPDGYLASSTGLAGHTLVVDWAFWSPVRLIIHSVILFFAAVWSATKCWEEVRRYG